ncbi:hypothetical protein [uncultured Clostridium sp.]|uniref:hypothetical protein n=1 Tax=uncultured Clostridium sp. TaxID=59620 RepID=UPI0025E2D5A7|nr:hypothetical protein [uncultured Clostridium sp.]
MNKISRKVIAVLLMAVCFLATIGSATVYAYPGQMQVKVLDQSDRSTKYSILYTSTKHWDGKRFGYKATIPLTVVVRKSPSNETYYFSSQDYSTIQITPKISKQTFTVKNDKCKKINKTFFSITADVIDELPGYSTGHSLLRVNFHVNPQTGQITAEDK